MTVAIDRRYGDGAGFSRDRRQPIAVFLVIAADGKRSEADIWSRGNQIILETKVFEQSPTIEELVKEASNGAKAVLSQLLARKGLNINRSSRINKGHGGKEVIFGFKEGLKRKKWLFEGVAEDGWMRKMSSRKG